MKFSGIGVACSNSQVAQLNFVPDGTRAATPSIFPGKSVVILKGEATVAWHHFCAYLTGKDDALKLHEPPLTGRTDPGSAVLLQFRQHLTVACNRLGHFHLNQHYIARDMNVNAESVKPEQGVKTGAKPTGVSPGFDRPWPSWRSCTTVNKLLRWRRHTPCRSCTLCHTRTTRCSPRRYLPYLDMCNRRGTCDRFQFSYESPLHGKG